ncbi:MAG: hypothetical protein BWY79_01622 [Actinobacteria bacterium ADurb.Bin444]|nr:MAG: hypothetical protein BWY79_01622 [Actinobacteria bacterium ADurb.Bin444]
MAGVDNEGHHIAATGGLARLGLVVDVIGVGAGRLRHDHRPSHLHRPVGAHVVHTLQPVLERLPHRLVLKVLGRQTRHQQVNPAPTHHDQGSVKQGGPIATAHVLVGVLAGEVLQPVRIDARDPGLPIHQHLDPSTQITPAIGQLRQVTDRRGAGGQ